MFTIPDPEETSENTMEYIDREDVPRSEEDTEATLLFFAIEWFKQTVCMGHRQLTEYDDLRRKKMTFSEREDNQFPIEEGIPAELSEVARKLLEALPSHDLAVQIRLRPPPSKFHTRYFFLMALTQAERYLRRLSEHNESYSSILSCFKDKNPKLAEVRNINEHFDEHLIDSGNKRYKNLYRDKNYVLDRSRSNLSDATGASGVVDEDGKLDIVIGNRVSIRKSTESAEEALVCLLKAEILSENEG